MLKKYRVRDYDFKLIILLAAVTVIGILSIGSAKAEVQNKQILGFVMGFFIMIVLSFFDYSFFLQFYWVIYGLNICLFADGNSFREGSKQRKAMAGAWWNTVSAIGTYQDYADIILFPIYYEALGKT